MCTTRKLGVLLLAVWLWASACEFSGGHSNGRPTNSRERSNAVLVINDADWDLRLIQEFTGSRSPDQIRCNSDGLCWAWNAESIWKADKTNEWREIYQLASQPSQAIASIESVFMPGPDIGWFITTDKVYRTVNGGRNWILTSAPGPKAGALRDVIFRDEKRGQIAGGEFRPRVSGEPLVNNAIDASGKEILIGTIWETNDGGATWQPKQLNRMIGRFTRLEFWGEIGLAFGDAGLLFTRDGGDTWSDLRPFVPRQRETGERPTVTGAHFLDNQTGWIFTSWFEHLFTTDGGKSWSILPSNVANIDGNPEEIIPSAGAFADKDRGLLIAGAVGTGKLLKSADGGKTWSPIVTSERFYDLDFFAREGFALGGKGIYLVTRK